MKIHILGICGTFMAGVAKCAKLLGHDVTGSDQHVYPPMSDVLAALNIEIQSGYLPEHIAADTDLVIIGNALSRGNAAVEFVLNSQIPYVSGAQWLYEYVLKDKHVLAVSGTHGKTTTTALLAWILTCADLEPGFLIGGLPKNFNETTALGGGKYFVIEADEYDTAFFDKRSKFLHYRPNTLIINNCEFDHADIFENLDAIKKQFQFLLRSVPANGSIIYPNDDVNVQDILSRGCWSCQVGVGSKTSWHADLVDPSGCVFDLWYQDQQMARIEWPLLGVHNVNNALAAAAAAHAVGVSIEAIKTGICTFENVKRRMEVRGKVRGITVYDDFAHHPTAIKTTLQGLRAKVGDQKIVVLAELGSNTMTMGVHQTTLGAAFSVADEVHILHPNDAGWDILPVLNPLSGRANAYPSVDAILSQVVPTLHSETHVLIMSNKGFGGIHQRLLDELKQKESMI